MLLPSGCNLRTLFKLSFESTVIWCQGGIGSLSTKGCQNPNCFLSSCNRWIMLQPTVHFSFCSKGFSLMLVVFHIHVFILEPSSFHLTFISFLERISFTTGIRKAVRVITSGNQWNIIILAWKHMFLYKENIFFRKSRTYIFPGQKGSMYRFLCYLPNHSDIPVKCLFPSRYKQLITSQGNLFPFWFWQFENTLPDWRWNPYLCSDILKTGVSTE